VAYAPSLAFWPIGLNVAATTASKTVHMDVLVQLLCENAARSIGKEMKQLARDKRKVSKWCSFDFPQSDPAAGVCTYLPTHVST